MNIAQIGHGFVGSALSKSFEKRGVKTIIYDKYQNLGGFDSVLGSDIIFLCLPTPYKDKKGFCLDAIDENLKKLKDNKYKGLCVIKSTVEPGVTQSFFDKYGLNLAHNPEFLTERTAFQDFDNQKHIVLGKTCDSQLFDRLVLLYKSLYPNAKISICSSYESESMKLFLNSFYAQKVMIFNEFYLLCKSIGIDFERVKELMLENAWIAPFHMDVPGPDGRLAYGGHCFPKDTMALRDFMNSNDVLARVLDAAIRERDEMRKD